MSKQPGLINKNEVALLLNVSPPTVQAYVNHKGLPCVQRGAKGREWLFNKADVLNWAAQRDNDTEDIEQAKLRKLIAEASREELKLAIEKQEVVEVEEVLRVVETEYANVRAKLLSLPTKAAPLITGVNDIVEVQEVLEQQINEVLEELSTQ